MQVGFENVSNLSDKHKFLVELMKEQLGYPHDFVPTYEVWRNSIHPEDQEEVFRAIQHHLDGKTELYHLVFRDREVNGTWRWASGLEATRRIRGAEAAKGLSRIPIIAMTAHALNGDRERCIKVGVDEYLSKPFKSTELEAALERFSSKATLEDA